MVKKLKKSKVDTNRKEAEELFVKDHPSKKPVEAVNFAVTAHKKLLGYDYSTLEVHEPEK